MPEIPGSYSVDREQAALTEDELETVRRFHELYYHRWLSNVGDTINLSWFGHRLLKCPMDLWIYQELLVKTRPDVIIETGTFLGGSALFLAMILDQLGSGEVISVDIQPKGPLPEHPRVSYILGSSTDPEVVDQISQRVGDKDAMVILDSNHTQAHVLAEIRAYCGLIKPGGYLVVEDTNINGHPAFAGFGPGPMEALEQFLAENDDFEVDVACERLLMTLNPSGYLRRKPVAR